MDSLGSFLLGENSGEKVGTFEYSSVSVPFLLGDANNSNSGDLLIYSEPWGGKQENPLGDGKLDLDPLMTDQGERPEVPNNLVFPEGHPASPTVIDDSIQRGPNSTEGTVPEDNTSDVPPLGYPNDFYGDGDAQLLVDRIIFANGGAMRTDSALVRLAMDRVLSQDLASQKRVKLACSIDDLLGFEKTASGGLVHKSSRDLWSVSAGPNGETFIDRQFDDNGDPLKG